MKVPHI